MNIFYKEKRGNIHVHQKCIIFNFNNKNLLYEFIEFNNLLDLIEKEFSIIEKEKALEFLLNNSEDVKRYNKAFRKQNTKKNDGQISLF